MSGKRRFLSLIWILAAEADADENVRKLKKLRRERFVETIAT